ncbi:MAG: hypothetical protein LBU02_02315, partial [Rickettsiales bacterium]|nr:hypothetical protein [Rickettsiales bacterium]
MIFLFINSSILYGVIQVAHENRTKKLLDNLRRYPYNDTEAICLTSQSVQVKMTRELVFGVLL